MSRRGEKRVHRVQVWVEQTRRGVTDTTCSTSSSASTQSPSGPYRISVLALLERRAQPGRSPCQQQLRRPLRALVASAVQVLAQAYLGVNSWSTRRGQQQR